MSWVDDNICEIYRAEAEENDRITEIMEKLNDTTLYELIANLDYLDTFKGVVEYYKKEKRLSERQKYVIAQFIRDLYEFYDMYISID